MRTTAAPSGMEPHRLAAIRRTGLDCTTWPVMCGNGWRIGLMRATTPNHPRPTRRDRLLGKCGLFVAAPGAILVRGSSVRRPGSGSSQPTATSTSDFVAPGKISLDPCSLFSLPGRSPGGNFFGVCMSGNYQQESAVVAGKAYDFLFSFGAVLYEMVTWRRAFDGDAQASLIAATLEKDPPPVSSVKPMAPRALLQTSRAPAAEPAEGRQRTATPAQRGRRRLPGPKPLGRPRRSLRAVPGSRPDPGSGDQGRAPAG